MRKLASDRNELERKKTDRDAAIEKKKKELADKKAVAEQKAQEDREKKAAADRLVAEAKERDAQKSRIASSAKLAFLGEGSADDLIAIVNVGQKAPHAVVDLHGKLTFADSAAIACTEGKIELSPLEARLYKDHLAALNVNFGKVQTAQCPNWRRLVRSICWCCAAPAFFRRASRMSVR